MDLKRMIVAAIDFGTTYSGAAISFCHEYERDPTQVYALKIGNPRLSMKTMTCILIKPDGKTCHKFGEDADSYYYEELEGDERKEWFLFKKFKMKLYDTKGQTIRTLFLTDVADKKLPAKTVFSLAIRFLKEEVLRQCKNGLMGTIEHEDIGWVLTVPAIWDDHAKGFMREAAEDAGIGRDKLVIALEPEAASIFCQHVPLVRDQPDVAKLVPFKVGMKYIVVDCGGGTVDITVHQVTDQKIKSKSATETHYVREIKKARGNNMGGTQVDDAFLNYLESIVGEDVMEAYKSNYEEDFRDLMQSFEEKKQRVEIDGAKVTISTKISEAFASEKNKTMKDHLKEIGNTNVSFPVRGKIRLDNSVVCGFFSGSISSITSKLEELFREPEVQDCKVLLMVGSYSESLLLQSRIKKSFPTKEVICPKQAGLAVLKGAVIYGHNPAAISERISRFTYGTNLEHDVFSILVEEGDILEVGKSNRVEIYHPTRKSQTRVSVNIYVSPNKAPEFVTEIDCVRIIERDFPIPDTTGGTSRGIEMCMIFGGTEFSVKVKNVDTGYEETFFVNSWD